MNILLSLACVLAVVTACITYVYLRGRNSFLRKLQGPESPSFLLGDCPYLPSPTPASSEWRSQEMSPKFFTRMKLENTNSNGCADTVPHGVELGHLE
jgi:hypothetical protein